MARYSTLILTQGLLKFESTLRPIGGLNYMYGGKFMTLKKSPEGTGNTFSQ